MIENSACCGCRDIYRSGGIPYSALDGAQHKVEAGLIVYLEVKYSACSLSLFLLHQLGGFDPYIERPPICTARLQAHLADASASQVSVLIASGLRSLLLMSLKRIWEIPAGLFPVVSSPRKRSLGIRPSSTLFLSDWREQRRL